MDRLSILVSRLINSMAATKYFVKVPLVGRFMPLVGGIGRLVESPLNAIWRRGEEVVKGAIILAFVKGT